MDWDNVRYVLAVARTGSYVGAAESLDVAHTTVSRRVSAMERALGVRLFERRSGSLAPTAAGEHVMRSARRIEADLLAMERRVLGQDEHLRGTLRVTVPYLLADHLLMPHLAAFARKHPEIELQVIASHAVMSLTRREADIAIRVTDRPPETAIGRRVAVLRWAIYVSDKARRRCRRADQSVPYIGIDDDSPVPEPYVQRYPGARMGMRVNDHALVVEAVRAGLGAGTLARFVGDQQPDLRRIVDLPGQDVSLWLLTHAELRRTARVRLFMETMHRALSRALAQSLAS